MNLTPIESYDNLLYKRDDFFKPFLDSDINGGKCRQCIALVEDNLDYINIKCNSTIATASSVHSPQGIIVSSVANQFDLRSILCIANTRPLNQVIDDHKNLQIAKQLGCDIRIVSKMGYNNVLYSKLNEISKKKKMFQIMFGMNLENDPHAIIDQTAFQCKNVPENLHDIIIPVGSGLSAGGILTGLIKYQKIPEKIWLIQIAGYDRIKEINRILHISGYNQLKIIKKWPFGGMILKSKEFPEVLYYPLKDYPYTKWLSGVGEPFQLDGRYELKAWVYAKNKIFNKKRKQLFWIIGNSTKVIKGD